MDLGVPPFSVQLPSGYQLSPGGTGTAAATAASGSSTPASTTPADPVDVVTISGSSDAGSFSAVAGDTFQLSGLFRGVAPTGQAVAGYRVALGAGSGQLLLGGVDVSIRTSFTADEFSHLSYQAGANDTQQSLVVAAQTGTRLTNGTLTQVTDSKPVQITANVTGTRSINVMSALTTADLGSDTDIAGLVSEANILTGVGTARPTLTTQGNFTTVANDTYQLGDLFRGAAPTGQSVAGYRVALGSGGGQLLLGGVDVSARTSFTADEFSHLSYKAGADGSQQSLVVAAQTGTRLANGTLTQVTDSQAVQITASVTGTRSLNAMKALTTTDLGSDTDIVGLVSEAGILTGVGTARPTLSTAGNFTTVAGDTYRLGDLFQGAAPAGQSVAGYRVALGSGGGQLLLDGVDVSTRTSFTADEFSHLSYTAGAVGTQQSLVVAAQTGTRLANGTLSQVTDSEPVQITASVTGTRSINTMSALTTADLGSDTDIAGLVSEAGILTGVGTARPTLNTEGNFSAVAGDTFRLGDLFQGAAPTGQSVAGYRVALGRGGGQLLLGGVDVTSRTSFTADEFSHLSYQAGANGTQPQSLVVAAQTGTRLANGTLTQVTDSLAVQISATVGPTRSINAMNALTTASLGSDTDIDALVSEAGILTGVGTARPTLSTEGNFTTAAGDTYQLGDLFQGAAPAGQSIAGYRVALGAGGGQLLLGGVDVSTRTSFTADEFSHLSYKAGADGSQSLVVAAQTGTRLANGTLSQVTDSLAVQITAGVTGTRSINAMNALTTMDLGSDTDIVGLVSEAGILTGVGTARPTLQTLVTPQTSVPADLASSAGAYTSAGGTADPAAVDLSSFSSASTGGSVTASVFADPSASLMDALLLLQGVAPGAFQVAGGAIARSQAIKAYSLGT